VTIAQYDYLGTSTLVRTRLNAIACFSRVYDGTNAIVDLDRFNRITTHRWTKDLATDRDLYQTVLSYDRASNITSIEDNVHTGFDAKYTLDGLQRLTQTEEGTLSSGSITSKTRDQQWTLSHTGNWDRAKLDLNGDGDFSDTSEHDDTRSHNAVNELTARDTDSNSSNNFTLTYDAAGNLRWRALRVRCLLPPTQSQEHLYPSAGRRVPLQRLEPPHRGARRQRHRWRCR